MEEQPRNVGVGTIGLIVLQVIFAVLMMVTISNLLRSERIDLGIQVSGLSQEVKDLPSDQQKLIEYYIYNAVAKNSSAINVKKSGAVIREGSLISQDFSQFNMKYTSFIVDLADVQQSYRVFVEWSDVENNDYVLPNEGVGVACLDKDLLIYGEFDCEGAGPSTELGMVKNFLSRYNYSLPGYNNNELKVAPEDWSRPDSEIQINYMSCDSQCECLKVDKAKEEQAMSAFGEFVGELGFRVEDVPHRFYNCEGEENLF